MKVLACLVLALAVFATAEEEKKDKRFAYGIGAYPYSYGAYPYSWGYPYSSPISYSALKTEVLPEKMTAYTIPKVSSWPYTSSVMPYSMPYSGMWPYSSTWSSPYLYGGYPYMATKFIK